MKKRREAFEVVNVDSTFSVIMNIMSHRYDATNYSIEDIDCTAFDNYIANAKLNGKRYNYMGIIIAAIVRTFAMRRGLNRFVMNARLYERYKITVCFMIKAVLKEDAPELLIKQDFNGNETLEQISRILDEAIARNINDASANASSQKAETVAGLPMPLSKMVVSYLKWSDKHNIMPKAFFDISPFHNSFFITNLKSIKTDAVLHHCYDFGTTSLFFSIGKDKWTPVADENKQVVVKKILQLGISTDERICDGLYHGQSFHVLRNLLQHPELLEEEYHDEKVDAEIEKDRIKREKEETKALKKQKNK